MSSCKTQEITPLNYKNRILCIGSGGGFTGVSTSYFLLDNGDLYRNGLSDTSFIKVGKLPQRVTDQQFDGYDKMGFNAVKMNNPGNRYYYLEMAEGKDKHKIQWGGSQGDDKTLKIFHKNLMNYIKKMNVNSSKT